MNRDGDGDGQSDFRIPEGRDEGRQPFREVVDGNGQGCEEAHAQEPGAALGLLPHEDLRPVVPLIGIGIIHLLNAVELMGVLTAGDEPVNEGDEKHPPEEGKGGHPGPLHRPQLPAKAMPGLEEDLHHGDIDHHPGRKAQADGKEAGIALPCEKSQGAADPGAEAGKKGEPEGIEKIIHLRCSYPDLSDVDAQKLLHHNPHHKGEEGHREADPGHLPEALPEGQVLSHGDIVGEKEDDPHHHQEHHSQSLEIHVRREEEIGEDQEGHSHQIHDPGIQGGLQGVGMPLRPGGKVL